MKITIDSAKVTVDNNRITLDIDKSEWEKVINSNKITLGSLNTGDVFKLGEEEFIVLEQVDSAKPVTHVIRKDLLKSRSFGDSADWKSSSIRTYLNGEYYNKIKDIIGAGAIIAQNRDLTSLDGLDDYGSCIDSVSLLTFDEYRKYHKVLGLNSNYPDWWWLITPASTPSNGYSRDVCYVYSGGVPYWSECGCSRGVRPFLTLDSSIFVL